MGLKIRSLLVRLYLPLLMLILDYCAHHWNKTLLFPLSLLLWSQVVEVVVILGVVSVVVLVVVVVLVDMVTGNVIIVVVHLILNLTVG